MLFIRLLLQIHVLVIIHDVNALISNLINNYNFAYSLMEKTAYYEYAKMSSNLVRREKVTQKKISFYVKRLHQVKVPVVCNN